MITFLYGQPYECNEYCKYYKNIENSQYKFIPAVHRTYYDGNVSHVTGIVNITGRGIRGDAGPVRRRVAARATSRVAESMDRFIDKVKEETNGELLGDLEIVRIPLNLYRARNATSRLWRKAGAEHHPFAARPCSWSATRRSARPISSRSRWASSARCSWRGSSPSASCPSGTCSTGTSCYMYKQWLRVYMRSKMIKHNKDLFETVDDSGRPSRSCTSTSRPSAT